MKYRKKLVVIEAFRFQYDVWPDWFLVRVHRGIVQPKGDHCIIQTLEGAMKAEASDLSSKELTEKSIPANRISFRKRINRSIKRGNWIASIQ